MLTSLSLNIYAATAYQDALDVAPSPSEVQQITADNYLIHTNHYPHTPRYTRHRKGNRGKTKPRRKLPADKEDTNDKADKDKDKDDFEKEKNDKGGKKRPTVAPSHAPSSSPSVPPTSDPTTSPTDFPSTPPTISPTPRPTYTPGAPTPSPTSFKDSFLGMIQIRFSLFFGKVLELEPLDGSGQFSTTTEIISATKDDDFNNRRYRKLSSLDSTKKNLYEIYVKETSEAFALSRHLSEESSALTSKDITAGQEIDLVQTVLSTTASTLCESKDTVVLVPVPLVDGYINHCDNKPISTSHPKGYTNKDAVFLIDWKNGEKALEHVDVNDRNLFVDNDKDGDDQYNLQVKWIEWGVTITIVQAPRPLWISESKDKDAVISKMEISTNQAVNMALSNGEFQEALQTQDPRILGSSSIGKEFDTFRSEWEKLLPDDDVDTDGTDSDLNLSKDEMEEKEPYKKFPPLRIIGISMMISTIIMLCLVFLSARRRNQDENWEVHANEDKGKLFADLGTQEGVDEFLTSTRNMSNTTSPTTSGLMGGQAFQQQQQQQPLPPSQFQQRGLFYEGDVRFEQSNSSNLKKNGYQLEELDTDYSALVVSNTI